MGFLGLTPLDVPEALRMVLLGGTILLGAGMFLAGLYTGLGALGKFVSILGPRGFLGGLGGAWVGADGMSRGPTGRLSRRSRAD